MSGCDVKVESTVFGSAGGVSAPPAVQFRLAVDRITVADLIRLVVEAQVEKLMLERASNAASVAMTLARHYLSDADIARQAQSGAVRMPETQLPALKRIDVERAVADAQRGFAEGVYRIAVEGQMYRELGETVPLAASAQAMFLRLTPLKGG